MRPRFLGAVGVISKTLEGGRALFVEALGLGLKQSAGTNFLASDRLDGSRYFGVWPLSEAARVCFGRTRWPANRPVPQAFLEFEVGSPARVRDAALELEARGLRLLHPPRTDPWGQTVTRFQTTDGLVIGISFVPWMHETRPKRGSAKFGRRTRSLTVKSARRSRTAGRRRSALRRGRRRGGTRPLR